MFASIDPLENDTLHFDVIGSIQISFPGNILRLNVLYAFTKQPILKLALTFFGTLKQKKKVGRDAH